MFRTGDVGLPKSEVAAAFVNKRVYGVQCKAHFNKIEDFGDDFYSVCLFFIFSQFNFNFFLFLKFFFSDKS